MHERELFLNDWSGLDCATLARLFGLADGFGQSLELLLASYVQDECGGEAFILFRQGEMLYEVNAGHDSGGSMVGQWEPEETLLQALRYRLEKGRLGLAEDGTPTFAAELAFLIAELEAEGFK